ncbi:hypothetical protein [Rhodobacter sp. 24-YEA-8]|uniref:hypothetical protein n=1 Tax=Rhodobacter sp. 24-YEA-8 TaxID=1884310 RepID=UPI00089B237C|nr:hypothetical protein [Rhodobacter sp. 24-YEA-8]SEC81850.1 hypothetical protein SAMN05519105_3350 [Rhodobacter sp. 24-YEA-8]
MILFLPIGLALLFFGLWYYRRGSTLTRACRWRLERHIGPDHYRCAACGAVTDTGPGRTPNACLRPGRGQQ